MENHQQEKETVKYLAKITRYAIYLTLLLVACIMIITVSLISGNQEHALATNSHHTLRPSSSGNKNQWGNQSALLQPPADSWKAPGEKVLLADKDREMIKYGKDLIAHTSLYLGPKGMVTQISNGMNCQNCHLDAGTKVWGNNYSAVYATYPKFRARSGTKETMVKRISDCFERSLNGKAPDSTGKEMKAIIAYMRFLGTSVKKGTTPNGAGLEKLPYLNRAANALKGAIVYQAKCVTCHGANGEGAWAADKKSYTYPPLWGKHSYNDGAGLYRVSSFAGYIKNNMPYGVSYKNPQLTTEEAWDIAAFINSQPRPHKDQHKDWKDLSKKPVDFPFSPYADRFSEKQHKYGPFKPIKAVQKNSLSYNHL